MCVRFPLQVFVLMEYMQVGISGREFIAEAKQFIKSLNERVAPSSKPRILVYSFVDPISHKEESLEAGADLYMGLIKRPDDIVTFLKEYLVEKKEEKERDQEKRDRLRGSTTASDEGLSTGDIPDIKDFF